nr:RING finger domain-containing protein [Sansalvadorimonas sp. 2012CJ34-2]
MQFLFSRLNALTVFQKDQNNSGRWSWFSILLLVTALVVVCPAYALCPHCGNDECTCPSSSTACSNTASLKTETDEDGPPRIRDTETDNWPPIDKDKYNAEVVVSSISSLGPYRINQSPSCGKRAIPEWEEEYEAGLLVTPLLLHDNSSVQKPPFLSPIVFINIHNSTPENAPHSWLTYLWLSLLTMPIDSEILFKLLYNSPRVHPDITEWFHSLKSPIKLHPRQNKMQAAFDKLDKQIRCFLTPASTCPPTPPKPDFEQAIALKPPAMVLTRKLVDQLPVLKECFQQGNIAEAALIFERVVQAGHIQLALPALEVIGLQEHTPLTTFEEVKLVQAEQALPLLRMTFAAASMGLKGAKGWLIKFSKLSALKTCPFSISARKFLSEVEKPSNDLQYDKPNQPLAKFGEKPCHSLSHDPPPYTPFQPSFPLEKSLQALGIRDGEACALPPTSRVENILSHPKKTKREKRKRKIQTERDYNPDLSCNICYEVFETESPNKGKKNDHRPAALTCGHSFCRDCISELLRYSLISCPKCRKLSVYTSVETKDFPVNFGMIKVLEALKSAQPIRSASK